MNDRCKPWGTAWGRLIAVFIISAILFASVALSVCYALYNESAVATTDIEVVDVKVEQTEDVAKVTLHLSLDDGKELSSFDTRIEDDCMLVTMYSALRGNYTPDKSGVTTVTLTADKSINYIRLECDGKRKDLVRITWREGVAAKDVIYSKDKISGNTLNLSLKLADKSRHICDYTSRTDGDKLFLKINAAPIVTDYAVDVDGGYTLSIPVEESIQSVWVEDDTGAKLKLCDISWPSDAVFGDLRFEVPRIDYETNLAIVGLNVALTDSTLYLWSYDLEKGENGVAYLRFQHNTVQGNYKKNDDGFFKVDFDINREITELRIGYPDGKEEHICFVEWPAVVPIESIILGEMLEDKEKGQLSFDITIPEELSCFNCDVQYEDGTAFISIYATKATEPGDNSETVKIKLEEDTDFVVLTDGEAQKTVYCVDARRLLESEDISLVSYTLKDGKLAIKLRMEKESFYLAEVKSAEDTPRLMVSFFGSAVEGDMKPDADGVYTVEFTLPEKTTSVVQEVPGNEKTLIKNINA